MLRSGSRARGMLGKMIDPQITGLRESFRQLVPSCSVECRYALAPSVEQHVGEPFRANQECGLIFTEAGAIVWLAVPGGRYAVLDVTRPALPLSRSEREFLNYFQTTALGLLVQSDVKNIKITGRMASRYSFEHVFVSRYLHRNRTGSSWTAALILSELQELSFQKYEGQACTSGFVFFSEPANQIARLGDEYLFQPFAENVRLEEGFFRTPTSYRYVDGRNAFYVVDRARNLPGVIRLREPTRYGRVARSAHAHLEPLLRGGEGRAWVVCSSRPHEVEAVARSGRHLRWNKSHWHFVDRSLLTDFLISRQIERPIAESLVQVVFALSEMHVGTVLLIPNTDDDTPHVAELIDSSPLALALVTSFAGRTLPEMLSDNSIIGVLGSDGLTVVRRNGAIASTGQIIDLQAERPSESSGGGRTQAALAASRHGIVIKVSQDGPVSLFINGGEVLKYNV